MRRWLLIPPVASLFAVSFYESWWALNKAAVAAKIPDPRPWPWAVDGFILVMALMVVFAAIDGHSWGTWWPRLGLLGATVLSTGIQAAWAPQADWAWALHAWSPLAVLSSFECLVWLVFGTDAARPKPATQARPPAPARLRAWLGSWEQAAPEVPATRYGPPAGSPGHDRPGRGEISPDHVGAGTAGPATPGRAIRGLTDQQQARVAEWRAETPPRSARWIAGQLGLSNHGRSNHLAPYIAELEAARVGGPSGNGGGP
jgi:hypothetical protein